MKRTRSCAWSALASVILIANSPKLLACTACFGQSDSNMAKGMNMGIAVLLLVITCVLAGVAGFFVFLARRHSQLNEPHFNTQFSHNRTNA